MGFLKGSDPNRDDSEVFQSYKDLKGLFVDEFTVDQMRAMPKMVWKTRAVVQCVIRRTIESVDGMRLAWNANNQITAITMARSLIETGAVVSILANLVGEAAEKRDTKLLDLAVMGAGFATRMEEFYGNDEEFKAKSILTLIEKMDKALFDDKKPRLLPAYEFLCEFAHPNYLGILGLYSDTEHLKSDKRIIYGVSGRKREATLSNLNLSLGMMWLVRNRVVDIENAMPIIYEFVPK